MKTYTKEEILKAAQIGEVSMIDAEHIVSLLDEAKEILQKNTECDHYFAVCHDTKGWHYLSCEFCGLVKEVIHK